jgi:polysaccharide export outer membrane protein
MAVTFAIVGCCAEAAFSQSSLRLVAESGQPVAANEGIEFAPEKAATLGGDLYDGMFTALVGDAPPALRRQPPIVASLPVDQGTAALPERPCLSAAPAGDVLGKRIVLNIGPATPPAEQVLDAATGPRNQTSAPSSAPADAAPPIVQTDVFPSLTTAVKQRELASSAPTTPAARPNRYQRPLPDITPIEVETPPAQSRAASDSIAHDLEHSARPSSTERQPALEVQTPLLALQPSRIARNDASAQRANSAFPSNASRSRLVSIPAARQPEEQPAPTPAVHSNEPAAPGGTPCIEEHAVPYGCPYYPWQSGTQAICGVDCGPHGAACCESWENARWIPWALLGPGEYVGPPRPEHVPVYYLRVNDLLTLTYIVSRQKQPEQYRIGAGDRLRIESGFDESIDREIIVQPDGDINLPLIGEVPAAGKTVKELREELIRRYGRIEREPLITVTLVDVNIGLREILNAVTSQSDRSGQALDLRVTPEGTIQAPGLGSVYVQGLTIEELRGELEARYAAMFGAGLMVSPALTERATSYVFLGGEVANPGRYTLEGPTTVMQAIALAGGWNNGGNTREIVVFRRDENWCLKATKINVHRPLYGKDPCPVNDVWLRDNDLVIVPKTKILCAADVIELYFTRGVYAVFPITFVKDFSRGSTMAVPIGP